MPSLVTSFNLGRLRCHALEAGSFRLDGGAMFGIVPYPLWTKHIPPDERNRITLVMRCLLIEHPQGPVLVDTGLGNKEDAKFCDIYGVDNAATAPAGRSRLEQALAEAGFRPEEVHVVVNTHLHFDHCGGNTWVERDSNGAVIGTPRLTFPQASHVVQWGELKFARHTNERTRASYLAPNFEPVAKAGKWRLLHGDGEVLPGIQVRLTPGHVPNHQSVVVRSQRETLVYLGDVMPTRHHLPLPWIMGYDLEPLQTLESKRKVLREAQAEGWLLVFDHDPDVVSARLHEGDHEPVLGDVVRAPGR